MLEYRNKSRMAGQIRASGNVGHIIAGLGGAVGCASDWRPGDRGFDPRRGGHSFVEIYYEILPSADSRRAVVCFWRKNMHSTG